MPDKKKKWRVSRRGFLMGLGATAGTLAVGVTFGLPRARLAVARSIDASNGASPTGNIPLTPDAWFEITADNHVRFFVPKIEMGQGVHTALAQIAADELEVAWADLEVVQNDTDRGFNDSTGNSNSVSTMYGPIREVAATLREMLKAEAARQWGVSPAMVAARDTAVYRQDNPTAQLTYGHLVQNAAGWDIPETSPPLKTASNFHTIGQPMPRLDFPDKLTGKPVYGYDAHLPTMLYGAVARPPTIEGKLRSAQPGDAPTKEGVVQVIIDGDFAGVVATSRQQAYIGINNLELVWDSGKTWQQADIEALTTVGEGQRVVIQTEGEVSNYLRDNDSEVISLAFRTPLAAHAHLEAQAALVDVQPDRVDAWVSTQSPFLVQEEIAKILDRPLETVVVTPTFLGGGFGRKLNVEAAVEAARLSAVAGQPVHVGWNREEDMRHGFFRPPTHHMLKGRLGDDGRLIAMQHEVASGDVLFSLFPAFISRIIGADFGAYRGAVIQYGIPHRQTISYRAQLPIRTGPWRGLGLLANTFAIESFMDEMAARAGVDPLTFRLRHLPDNERGRRFKNTLEAVATRANWGGTVADGRAQGIALCLDANTVVAQVAEVSIEEGQIRVHKVTAAVDPGLVINPDGVMAQTQGCVMMGLSSTLFEEITIKNSIIEASNFDRYPLLTMKEAPDVDVVLLESSDTPNGIGEPPIGPVAAAVGNAVYRLTGQRLTRLPMKLHA